MPHQDDDDEFVIVDHHPEVSWFESDAEHIRAPHEWPTLEQQGWDHCEYAEYGGQDGTGKATAVSYAAAAAAGARAKPTSAALPRPVGPPSHIRRLSAVREDARKAQARSQPRRERPERALDRWSETSFHSKC